MLNLVLFYIALVIERDAAIFIWNFQNSIIINLFETWLHRKVTHLCHQIGICFNNFRSVRKSP